MIDWNGPPDEPEKEDLLPYFLVCSICDFDQLVAEDYDGDLNEEDLCPQCKEGSLFFQANE